MTITIKEFLQKPSVKIIKPSIRYSFLFRSLRGLFSLFEKEIWIRDAMSYVMYEFGGGNYLEFGVCRGASFIAAYYFAKIFKTDMKFYAFDSFEGLPEIEKEDEGHRLFYKGNFSCSLDNFMKNLKKNKVDLNKVEVIKGWYKDSLTSELKKKIKFATVVYIDCDLYSSTKEALDFITDLVVDGTIIIFDDWTRFKNKRNKGEQKAFWEWLDKNPSLSVAQFNTINSFVIHKGE